MAFNTKNYFGNTCPAYEPDDTLYGPGTSHPAGFTLWEMMLLFWQVDSFTPALSGGGSTSGSCPVYVTGGPYDCDCNASADDTGDPAYRGGGSGSATPDTMTGILCGGVGALRFTTTNSGGGGSCIVVIDLSSILCSDPLIDATDWYTNTYYPFISVTGEVYSDGSASSGCETYVCSGGITFSSDGAGAESGFLVFKDGSGNQLSGTVQLYAQQASVADPFCDDITTCSGTNTCCPGAYDWTVDPPTPIPCDCGEGCMSPCCDGNYGPDSTSFCCQPDPDTGFYPMDVNGDDICIPNPHCVFFGGSVSPVSPCAILVGCSATGMGSADVEIVLTYTTDIDDS